MFSGIKNTDSSNGIKYSSMTTEEKMNFQKKVIQDGLNFSMNFSKSNFLNYNNITAMNIICQRELKKAERLFNETKFDEIKKMELLKLAKNPNESFALQLSRYSENEVKFFKNIVLPYVQKENAAEETRNNLLNCYQNYIIYKDISELWTAELDAINKYMMFENYRKKNRLLDGNENICEERKEEAKKNKIEKIQRRIKMHIVKNKNGEKVEGKEIKEEAQQEYEEVEKLKINFDDWL